jgi:heat shock protein HtpX
MRRFAVFFAVNAAVLIVIGMLLNLLGVRPYLRSQGISYDGLLVFCALWGFVGSFVSLQISRWAAKRAMGVQLIDPNTPSGAVQSHLVGRIRDLSQRAGLKTLPEIGVYRSPEVNAFATGPSRDRALVAVSTGLLERMDDEAVEGVLGHEISHIANGDMVTMALVQGVVNTFVMFFARVIAQIIDSFLRRDDEGGGLGFFGYFIVVSILDTVLMLLASPIVYAFSRYREYRADAGSAKLTRPGTMIHALEALGRNSGRFDKQDAAIATMKIQGGAHGLLASLFSSHPPIPSRIQALRQLSAS